MMHQARFAYERSRWLRPDAARWVRPDAARFLKPGTRPEDVYPALALKYSPNQPRVPAGSTGGGQWTSGGGGGRPRVIIDTTNWGNESEDIGTPVDEKPGGEIEYSVDNGSTLDDIFASHDNSSIYDPPPGRAETINDSRVISDADPEVVKPGEQYAQASRNRGALNVRINGQTVEITPAQAARLEIVRARAEEAIGRVRELDSRWKPTGSIYETANGLIRSYEANELQAKQRLSELASQGIGPGPFAAGSIPARGTQRRYTAEEIEQNNRNGYESGCHTCGTRNPGTRSGNFVFDHQKPTALNSEGRAQRLYPQCVTCSASQGGYVSSLKRSW